MHKTLYNLILAFMLGIAINGIPAIALAERTPKSLISDHRMKQVSYDPMQVYTVYGYDRRATTVAFEPGEQIQVVTTGDSIGWQAIPDGDRIYLKPVEDNALTNMTIRTNRRTYFLELRPAKTQKDITYLVQFRYPENESTQVFTASATPLFDKKNFDPATLNLDYKVSGDEEIFGLKRVFDDGQFTYFLFEEGSDIPAFYRVLPDGTEAIVNTRREGNYMVVERVDSLFTLRNGKTYLCVANSAKPYKRYWFQSRPAEPKTGGVKR